MPLTPDMDGSSHPGHERHFVPEPHAAREARLFVLELGWSDDADTNLRLSTVVSEVVTNAILHARTPFKVTVTPRAEAIRVAVSDESDALPALRTYDSFQPTGRGLHIVESMADRWGVSPNPPGKTVWFELERESKAG